VPSPLFPHKVSGSMSGATWKALGPLRGHLLLRR